MDEPTTRSDPTAASEEGHRTAGQRRTNLLWEVTQSLIAVGVTGATLYVSSNLVLTQRTSDAATLLLSNAFFLVIGGP